MRKLYWLVVASFIAMCFITACEDNSVVELSRSERKKADSLYNLQRDSLDKYLDSICSARYDSIYESMYDSILEKRLRNIRKLYPDEQK